MTEKKSNTTLSYKSNTSAKNLDDLKLKYAR